MKIIDEINISGLGFEKIPDVFSDVTVEGNFRCIDNSLTSLEGAPEKVGGSFLCYYNSLTSLKGAPEKVGGDFYCSNNSLTSLEGAPKEVGRDFYCSNNTVNFTEEQVRAVCDVKGRIFA